MLAALDESPQHVVHPGLVTPTGFPEPSQHIGIDADIDVLLSRRQTRYGLAPIRRLVHVIGIGSDAGLELSLRHSVDLRPIGAALATPAHGNELFSRIAHRIVSFLHCGPSSL